MNKAFICTTRFATLSLTSCATDPDGKKIFNVIDSKQLSAMGLSAFEESKSKDKVGQVGVMLPFSRKHESVADRAGQILMARAGYNPAEAASLWQNMLAASKGAPPQWLSTHPNSEKRMEKLAAKAPELQALAETARALAKGQACPR